MRRQIQAGVLIVLVTLIFVVLGFSVWDATKFKHEVGVVQSVITSVAILVGGAFAIFKFQLFRDFEPHLSISQEVSHRFISNKYTHIAVTSSLNNNSRVRVELTEGFFRVQQILPITDEEVEKLYSQVFSDNKYEDIQWPTLDDLQRTSANSRLIVEPGESHQETCEFIISSDVKSILLYTYFYNSKYYPTSQSAEGWAATTAHDIVR